jgi:hypothetical protein
MPPNFARERFCRSVERVSKLRRIGRQVNRIELARQLKDLAMVLRTCLP